MPGYEPAQIYRRLNGALYVGTAAMLGRAIAKSMEPLPELIQALGKELDAKNFRTKKMRKANEQIARSAHKAMVAGYKSRLPNPGHTQYRRGNNRLSGRLGRHLAAADMTAGTSDRVISFINEARLSERSRHWYRVNYGTPGTGGVPAGEHSRAAEFEITLGGAPLLTISDRNPPSKTPHMLPPAFAIRGEGQARELWLIPPGKDDVPVPGKGTRAARFTDLGLAKVAQQFPEVYLAEWNNFVKENRKQLAKRDILVNTNLKVDRFGGFRVEVR
ncbi:hypothetical protein [Caudovirales GX15bay]|nr:hypothetical protein [Caudovirales GX15bay]